MNVDEIIALSDLRIFLVNVIVLNARSISITANKNIHFKFNTCFGDHNNRSLSKINNILNYGLEKTVQG
jgi:hypothetical protein